MREKSRKQIFVKGYAPEIRNITILDLVNRCAASTRLKNCVASAAKAGELPFNTINGFLEAGRHAKEKLLGVRNLGEKTANELIAIIDIAVTTGLPESEIHIKPKDCLPEIRNITILDLVNRCATSVKLKNCIASANRVRELPFNTINDLLEAGEHASKKLLDTRRLDKETVNELISVINTVIEIGLPESERHIEPKDCPPEIRNITILDIVNRCATSVKLKNCIASADKAGKLPFNTINDFLEAGEHAAEKLLDTRRLAKGTVYELIGIINAVIETGLPKPERHIKSDDLINFLNNEYPEAFQPLIDEYVSTPDTELSKLSDLEKVLRTLSERQKHAEMVWRKFSGETLESIGKSFGVTRARVQQITNRYSEYTTDVNSPGWAEKSIRHLINRTNTENRLPDNQVIKRHHPKLATSLVKNFSNKESGKLTPKRRLEIAKALNLNIDYEPSEWTLEKVIFELKKFAEKIRET